MQRLAPNAAAMWGLFAIWQYCVNPRRILDKFRNRKAVKCPYCVLYMTGRCGRTCEADYTFTDVPAVVARMQRKDMWLLIETPDRQHYAVYVNKERRIHIREHGQLVQHSWDTSTIVTFDMPHGRYEVVVRTDPHFQSYVTVEVNNFLFL